MAAQSPEHFVIDRSLPYVYIEVDHVGDRKPAGLDEVPKGIWLRLVNNCTIPIRVLTFDLGTDDPGVGVNYSVEPVDGFYDSSQPQQKPPAGYSFHTGTYATIAPRGSLLFSIPADRISPRWYIQLRFDFKLAPQKRAPQPYNVVEFRWENLPEKYRIKN
jgi:hypothetical protein